MTVRSRVANARFDVVAAALALLLAVALAPLRLLSDQIYIVTLPVVLGVAAALYLASVRWRNDAGSFPRLPTAVTRLAPGATFAGLAAMVALAVLAGHRTLAFYALGAVVGTGLLAQSVFAADRDLKPGLVLAQIVAYAAVLRYAALVTAPGVIGVDGWSHLRYARMIHDAGSLAPIAESKYYASPLFHLLAVTATDLFGVSVRDGIYLTVGAAMPLSVCFLYATGRLLVPVRWALAAAALYAVADHSIRWGIHVIPTSLGLLFFLAIAYTLTRLLHTDHGFRDVLLLVVFVFGVVLTHQISSFIVLVVLGVGLLAQLLLRFDVFRNDADRDPLSFGGTEPVNLAGLLAFDLGLSTFAWSMTPYKGDTFLETVLNYLRSTLVESAGFLNLAGPSGESAAAGGGSAAASAGSPRLAELALYLDTVGFLLLLFAATLGSLVALHRKWATQTTYTYVGVVAVMLVFVLGLPLFGIRNFVPGRWIAYLYAPLALLGVVGLGHVARNVRPGVAAVVLVVFAVATPAAMVASSEATLDNPVISSERVRYAYTDAELAAVDTLGDVEPTGTEFHADHPYQTVFDRTDAHSVTPITVANGSVTGSGTFVYREYAATDGAYVAFEAGGADVRYLSERAVCPPTADTVYANGEVTACRRPG
ncbi:hypothetical protein [Halobacterium litoreum]|uniref:Dolichyl-phosphate-mannose-protein mannosyltransferase n=1 Tax=Halobacterium litoreum TaxID=2039234 RepID=A0ABD5NC15_9EURY|nr:hypothetical protein [Halobacterium litoreum]UHH14401.1 hypothetical protein LT972_05220 [Halobacterium litoreum]